MSVRGTDSGFTVGKPGRTMTTRQTVQEKPSRSTVSWQVTVAETTPAPPTRPYPQTENVTAREVNETVSHHEVAVLKGDRTTQGDTGHPEQTLSRQRTLGELMEPCTGAHCPALVSRLQLHEDSEMRGSGK